MQIVDQRTCVERLDAVGPTRLNEARFALPARRVRAPGPRPFFDVAENRSANMVKPDLLIPEWSAVIPRAKGVQGQARQNQSTFVEEGE